MPSLEHCFGYYHLRQAAPVPPLVPRRGVLLPRPGRAAPSVIGLMKQIQQCSVQSRNMRTGQKSNIQRHEWMWLPQGCLNQIFKMPKSRVFTFLLFALRILVVGHAHSQGQFPAFHHYSTTSTVDMSFSAMNCSCPVAAAPLLPLRWKALMEGLPPFPCPPLSIAMRNLLIR